MKQVKKEAVEFLLQAAKNNLVEAVRIAHGGKNPVGKDLAELMAAWGAINEVTTGSRAPAERAMHHSLTVTA